MATEPVNTSNSYSSSDAYTPPVGRLPILGKARVAIDQIRVSIAAALSEMAIKKEAQADAHLRALAEVALLDQKTATELANVSDTITANTGKYAGTVAGVTKAQKDLYTAQKDGFARDAEQKLTKIVMDTWSIQKSMGDQMAPDTAGIAEYQMRDIVNKARTGIGVDITAVTPGPPTDIVAVTGDTEATISFTAPADNGGNNITEYTVTTYTGGNLVADKTATGETSPLTVTGLTNGTTYTFKVAARNAIGLGSESSASNAVTPTV